MSIVYNGNCIRCGRPGLLENAQYCGRGKCNQKTRFFFWLWNLLFGRKHIELPAQTSERTILECDSMSIDNSQSIVTKNKLAVVPVYPDIGNMVITSAQSSIALKKEEGLKAKLELLNDVNLSKYFSQIWIVLMNDSRSGDYISISSRDINCPNFDGVMHLFKEGLIGKGFKFDIERQPHGNWWLDLHKTDLDSIIKKIENNDDITQLQLTQGPYR